MYRQNVFSSGVNCKNGCQWVKAEQWLDIEDLAQFSWGNLCQTLLQRTLIVHLRNQFEVERVDGLILCILVVVARLRESADVDLKPDF